MGRALAGFSVVVAMALSWPGWSAAQDAGPRLRVVTADGRTTFRIGERIPLELVFTGPGDRRYSVTTNGGGRTVGLDFEKFEVSPEGGWADPLKIEYDSMGGFGGDWMSSVSTLSTKPVIVPIDLNDWVRFDLPGKYQVTVSSQRVADSESHNAQGIMSGNKWLRSNPIDITIVPAAMAWQKAKLAEIEAVLAKPVTPNQVQPDSTKAAMADLRALGTAGAAAVMARHLHDDDALMYQCAYGLMGLPEAVRPAAVADLNAEIDDPNFPISGWFLDTMAVLQVSEGPPEAMRVERQRLDDQAWQSAFDVLESKQGKAQAATVQALFGIAHKQESQEQKSEIGRVMAADLTEMTKSQQANALQYQWGVIGPHIGLPTLRQLAETPLKDPESNASDNYAKRELKSAALRRWYELDPSGAQQEVLREIGTPNPELTAQALSFLPKEKLPQFEYMWAQQFAATSDALYAGLLAKFGEGDAVALVESKLNANVGNWACAPQDAALAYVAEFDPDNALPLIEQALHARGKGQTGCYQQLFQDIDQYATAPVLTKVAIEAVNDPDAQVAINALNYLTWFGDVSAKNSILNRYAAWTAQWHGRADEMDAPKPGGSPYQMLHPYAIGLGDALVQALLGNQGWIADQNLIAKVVAGCVGEQVCRTAKQMAQEVGPGPYSLMVFPQTGSRTTFSIAQYQIKSIDLLDKKVAQFPKGTRFELPYIGDPKLEDRIKVILTKNGMILVREHANGAG